MSATPKQCYHELEIMTVNKSTNSYILRFCKKCGETYEFLHDPNGSHGSHRWVRMSEIDEEAMPGPPEETTPNWEEYLGPSGYPDPSEYLPDMSEYLPDPSDMLPSDLATLAEW